jgi:hypothetical protein
MPRRGCVTRRLSYYQAGWWVSLSLNPPYAIVPAANIFRSKMSNSPIAKQSTVIARLVVRAIQYSGDGSD